MLAYGEKVFCLRDYGNVELSSRAIFLCEPSIMKFYFLIINRSTRDTIFPRYRSIARDKYSDVRDSPLITRLPASRKQPSYTAPARNTRADLSASVRLSFATGRPVNYYRGRWSLQQDFRILQTGRFSRGPVNSFH